MKPPTPSPAGRQGRIRRGKRGNPSRQPRLHKVARELQGQVRPSLPPPVRRRPLRLQRLRRRQVQRQEHRALRPHHRQGRRHPLPQTRNAQGQRTPPSPQQPRFLTPHAMKTTPIIVPTPPVGASLVGARPAHPVRHPTMKTTPINVATPPPWAVREPPITPLTLTSPSLAHPEPVLSLPKGLSKGRARTSAPRHSRNPLRHSRAGGNPPSPFSLVHSRHSGESRNPVPPPLTLTTTFPLTLSLSKGRARTSAPRHSRNPLRHSRNPPRHSRNPLRHSRAGGNPPSPSPSGRGLG